MECFTFSGYRGGEEYIAIMELTTDKDKINSVLKHPYIWPRIANNGQNIEDFDPPMEDMHYLYGEGVLIILHPLKDKLQIHVNVIPEYRERAEEATKEAFEYGFKELGATEIVAKIPKKYGNVYGFALKFMEDVGFADGKHLLISRVEKWAS